MNMEENTENKIMTLVREYYRQEHSKEEEFIPGKSRINYAGRVFDKNEIINLTTACLDFWLTHNVWCDEFEKKFSKFLGVRFASFVNSGSSANLLAISALMSPLLGDRKLDKGNEVITIACGFPTTVAPIIQNGLIPVFVDIKRNTLNIDYTQLEEAISVKTRAVMIAHTLGNPFDVKMVKEFCDKHDLWLVEDNCDALGSTWEEKFTGTFGDIATSSFYPPHHITTGEGGMVYTDNPTLHKIVKSLRDWGRDCTCESGEDNKCGKRFEGQFGTLPYGYDHKYVYSHFGYNLKATEMQGAIGCAQIDKLPEFIKKRRENFDYLYDELMEFDNYFLLPKQSLSSNPSWFGFWLTLQEDCPFERNDITSYLEQNNIQTRLVFAGNILRQPLFQDLWEGHDYIVVGDLENTDYIMQNTFWFGVYPGLKKEQLDFIIKCIKEFIKENLNEEMHKV